MFKLVIAAQSMSEMKSKIREAAEFHGVIDNIKAEEAMTESEELGYQPAGKPNPTNDFPSFPAGAQPGFVVPASQTDGISGDEEKEYDSRGIPWDDRIHSSTKSKTKDGSWRYAKGVDRELAKQIEDASRSASLASNNGQQSASVPPYPGPGSQAGGQTSGHASVGSVAPSMTPPPIPLAPAAVAVPVFQQPVPTPQLVVAPPVQASQPAPAAPAQYENIPIPQNTTKPAHSFETFRANFIPVLAELIRSQAITQEYVEQLKQHFQVAEIWDVKSDDAKARDLFENFCAHGLITKVG